MSLHFLRFFHTLDLAWCGDAMQCHALRYGHRYGAAFTLEFYICTVAVHGATMHSAATHWCERSFTFVAHCDISPQLVVTVGLRSMCLQVYNDIRGINVGL